MPGIIFIAAAGIFVIGVGVGIVLVVSHGIHREQRRFDEERRYREERGIWHDPGAPEYFLPEAPKRSSRRSPAGWDFPFMSSGGEISTATAATT